MTDDEITNLINSLNEYEIMADEVSSLLIGFLTDRTTLHIKKLNNNVMVVKSAPSVLIVIGGQGAQNGDLSVIRCYGNGGKKRSSLEVSLADPSCLQQILKYVNDSPKYFSN